MLLHNKPYRGGAYEMMGNDTLNTKNSEHIRC
jgi:hypothetical protein